MEGTPSMEYITLNNLPWFLITPKLTFKEFVNLRFSVGFCVMCILPNPFRDTVDGSEIRRSPVEVGPLSHYLRRVLAPPRWWFGNFWTINSLTGRILLRKKWVCTLEQLVAPVRSLRLCCIATGCAIHGDHEMGAHRSVTFGLSWNRVGGQRVVPTFGVFLKELWKAFGWPLGKWKHGCLRSQACTEPSFLCDREVFGFLGFKSFLFPLRSFFVLNTCN